MPVNGDRFLEHRRTIARRVDESFGDHPAVSAVLAFASVASGHVDEQSDVDMLIICRSAVLPVPDRRAILSRIGSGWRFHDQSGDNALFADRDADGRVDGVLVTVHYQTVPWVEEVLGEVLDKGAIITEKLPFRPYTLPALLQHAWVLRDTDGVVQRWRARASIYPKGLKVNILRHFVPLLHENVEDLKISAERGIGPRIFIFLLDRAVDALISILFAVNEVYDPADKRGEQTILPTLAHAPTDFMCRWTEVLEGPFDQIGAQHRAGVLDRLATEVLKMAEDVVDS